MVDRIIPPQALEDMLAKVAKRKIIPTPMGTGTGGVDKIKRAKLPTTAEMFEQGLLKNGDTVMVKKQVDSAATVIDYKAVNYKGTPMTWNAWAKLITEWSAVNIYANVTISDGRTLDELRGNTD